MAEIEKLHRLKEDVCEELQNMAGKGINAGNVEMLDMLARSCKNLGKIIMTADDYSGAGDWRAYGNYEHGGRMMADRDYSYRDGGYGGYNERGYSGRHRDSMGRYARGSGREAMIKNLEDMMDDAATQSERTAIRNCLDQLRAK